MFYVRNHIYVDFLYVTVYETFDKSIRSDNVTFYVEHYQRELLI